MEYFDIYNEKMEHMGTELRGTVHKKGLWHKTFQCWFLNKEEGKDYILFQKRHESKDTYPNLLDITAAGHLSAGEKIEDGIRELQEELGLEVSFKELVPLGVIKERKVEDNFIDAEFGNVFLYHNKLPMEQFRLQTDEVIGMFKLEVADAIKLLDGTKKKAVARGYEVDSAGDKHELTLHITLEDLVPHSYLYYRKVFEAAKNYFKK